MILAYDAIAGQRKGASEVMKIHLSAGLWARTPTDMSTGVKVLGAREVGRKIRWYQQEDADVVVGLRRLQGSPGVPYQLVYAFVAKPSGAKFLGEEPFATRDSLQVNGFWKAVGRDPANIEDFMTEWVSSKGSATRRFRHYLAWAIGQRPSFEGLGNEQCQ